jgi:hypothetical protein
VAARISVCSAAKPVKRQTRTSRAFARRIASRSSAKFSPIASFAIDALLDSRPDLLLLFSWTFILTGDQGVKVLARLVRQEVTIAVEEELASFKPTCHFIQERTPAWGDNIMPIVIPAKRYHLSTRSCTTRSKINS